jgi:hypothetical protein
MKRADNDINERDEIRYQLKEKIVKATDLEEKIKKYSPQLQKQNNDTGLLGGIFSIIGIITSAAIIMRD